MSKVVCALTALCLWAATAVAAPPVMVEHALLEVGAPQQGEVQLTYEVTVTNPGEAPLSQVALELVPLAPLRLASEPVALEIAELGARLGAHFEISVPAFDPGAHPEALDRLPLHWAGRAVDGSGTAVEFPATSYEGGLP